MSVSITKLFTADESARIHITVEWPWHSLRPGLVTKGISGIVFAKDKREVARFSDFSDRDGIPTNLDYRSTTNKEFLSDVVDRVSRYETQIIVPPGDYQLRIVLSDGETISGTQSFFTVPNYDRKDLTVSEVTLCEQVVDISGYTPHRAHDSSGDTTAKLFANYKPLISNGVEFKPTGNTRFPKGEALYAFFELYEPLLTREARPSVVIQIRVVDTKTGQVKSDTQPIEAATYIKTGNPIVPIGRGVDASKLPKGSYRLEVRASDSEGGRTDWRGVDFRVE
jgi:hypothetical protein